MQYRIYILHTHIYIYVIYTCVYIYVAVILVYDCKIVWAMAAPSCAWVPDYIKEWTAVMAGGETGIIAGQLRSWSHRPVDHSGP